MSPHALPSEITSQIPETKGLLFVRLPDRVLLIDPDERKVIEIVADASKSNSDAVVPIGTKPGVFEGSR
jgi:hypothetical protein